MAKYSQTCWQIREISFSLPRIVFNRFERVIVVYIDGLLHSSTSCLEECIFSVPREMKIISLFSFLAAALFWVTCCEKVLMVRFFPFFLFFLPPFLLSQDVSANYTGYSDLIRTFN